MEKEYVQDGILHYRKLFRKQELPVTEIVWAYLQQEEVHASMCCGSFQSAIGRLILRTERGEEIMFQYEDGLEKPKKLLAALQAANPEMAVGFTAENKARFGVKK